ncbi:hypothetical protein C8R46DRAFT_421712 [Mycena filopes]|nr:hypothetical protein C8R46DRAFT_421712 [Mycena filopes]
MHPPPSRPRRIPWLLGLLAAAHNVKAIPSPLVNDEHLFDAYPDPPPPPPPQTTGTHSRHHPPPQYSPDPNGVWRRVDSYTLVGSTVCDTCTANPTTTSIAATDDEFMASIPNGWVRDSVTTPVRTTVTVALSVALACFIIITIFRYHFTRKPRPKADVEKRRHPPSTPSAKEVEKKQQQPQTQARKWMSRASARWRDNTRYLARQRRGRRHMHSRRASVESLVVVSSVEAPRAPSPVPSTRSHNSNSSSSSSSSLSLPLEAEVPQPPAYPVSPPPPLADAKAADAGQEDADAEPEEFPPYTPRGEFPPSTSSFTASAAAEGNGNNRGYFDDLLAAGQPRGAALHVATDDKTLLARLAEGASAPGFTSSSPSHVDDHEGAEEEREEEEAHAPDADELLLEELEECDVVDFAASQIPQPPLPHPPQTQLPSPPPPATRASGGSEKLALERAMWAPPPSSPSSFPSSSSYHYQYHEDVPAPSYPESAEAGPSTPRAAVVERASAPPMFWEDEYDEYYGEGEEGEGGASAPPAMFADDDDDDEYDGEAQGRESERESESAVGEEGDEEREDERQADGERHAPVGAGEAHDTGWASPSVTPPTTSSGDGDGDGDAGGEGAGQGHDR